MALLKDLLVRGESVLIGNATAGTIYADHFVMNGSTNQYVLLGDGSHYPLSSISSTSHTHLVTINGATKSIGATSVDLGNYLPIAGGTMTGLITTKVAATHQGIKAGNTYINAIDGNLIFQNNSSIRFGGDSWDYNVWAGLKYVHSSKTVYLGIADNSIFTANSAQTGGVLVLPGIEYISFNNTTPFYNSSSGTTTTTRDANNMTYSGHWYYTSNGPSTTLGASTNDGALYSQAYSTAWVAQIAQDYRNGRLFVRGKNNGTWQSWLKVIDSGNIGSQSVNYATSAGTATNLASAPSLQAGTSDTKKITVTAGGQTSSEFTVPFATNADKLDGYDSSYFHIQTARSYSSVDALPSSGTEGWYNIFTINDSTYGAAICTIKAYAHSSLTFVVSKGYSTSSTLQILQYNNSGNGSFFYVKGVRILSDGKVQALFNKPSANNSSYVSVNINIFSSTGTLRPNETLILETATLDNTTTPSVLRSLNGTANSITSDLAGNATTATTATNLTNKPVLGVSGTTQITVKAGEKTSDAFTVPYATTALNLTNKPVLAISGTTQMTVKAGEKTSDPFTVPYATNAGDSDTIDEKHLSTWYKIGYADPYGQTGRPWHLVAEYTQSNASGQINQGISLYVRKFYPGTTNETGILVIRCRYEAGAAEPSFYSATWQLNTGFSLGNFIITHKRVDNVVTLRLYAKTSGWGTITFSKIDEGGWGIGADSWNLYGAHYVNNPSYTFAEIPADETQISSTLMTISNNAATATTAVNATTATNLASAPSFASSGTTQITLTAGGKTSAAFTVPYATTADTIDGLDSTAFVKRQANTHFYPYIGSSYGKQWYKVTLTHNGHYRDSASWYMVAMEINLSAAYNEGAHGKIFLSFYFSKAAGQAGAYTVGDVKAIAIGKRLKYNSISIKYDLANPAIFYIHANNNNYNSISISNLSANDTAPSFDYRNTTIEGIDSCPSSADKVVPITILDTTTGGETTTYSDFILSASGDSPGLIFNRTGGNEVDWKAYVSNGDFFFSTATDASTWSTKLKIANSTGDIYVGSNKVLHAGTTYVTSGVGTINNTTITKVENATNADKTKTVTSSSASNHYLTFVDSDNSSTTAESIYTTSKLYVKPSTGDVYSSGRVYVNNTTASLGASNAATVWIANSSGYPIVAASNVVRRGADLTTGQLGDNTYPWAKTYTTTWCTANYEVKEYSSRMAFGSHGQTVAKGINIGDLLVSNAWADSTKVPTNGIYSKGIIKSGASIEATTYMRATDGNTYVGSASGTQCHMKYDTSLECLKFIFD